MVEVWGAMEQKTHDGGKVEVDLIDLVLAGVLRFGRAGLQFNGDIAM